MPAADTATVSFEQADLPTSRDRQSNADMSCKSTASSLSPPALLITDGISSNPLPLRSVSRRTLGGRDRSRPRPRTANDSPPSVGSRHALLGRRLLFALLVRLPYTRRRPPRRRVRSVPGGRSSFSIRQRSSTGA